MTERLPPARREHRMQRVRVGLTGLAAVVLIVTLATAIASGVSRRAAVEGNRVMASENGGMPGNAVEAPAEPLAQLGVAPGGGKDIDQTKVKSQR